MCGIAGAIGFGGRRISPVAVQRMVTCIGHRGPDGQGSWHDASGSVALAHTRLAILDTTPLGRQPMTSANGRYVIVYNGEIYNFLEIAGELKRAGYELRTHSDTEVILAAYEAWGGEMLHKFNGMWALAIFDAEKEELFLSRDRYGVKPLYYYSDSECFVFASEIKAIQNAIPERVQPNTEFLNSLVRYELGAYGSGGSYLRQVTSLSPGANISVLNGNVAEARWYRLPPVEVPKRFESQVEQMRALLIDACQLRLRSDVPVATCLSGGVDSGSIVSILGREHPDRNSRSSHFSHRSFTAAFPGTELDESQDARLVADVAGMQFDSYVITAPAPADIEAAMNACDGPMPALSFYPIWKLYRHIKDSGITVTIDGQGADEMLGGYYLGYPALRGAWQTRNVAWMRDVANTYGALHVNGKEWIRNDLAAWRRNTGAEIDQALKRPLKRMLAGMSLYDAARLVPRPKDSPYPWVSEEFSTQHNELTTALLKQFFFNPLPFLLHQYDRCSMASGVECRMPFMDYRIVEFVFSLPLSSKIGGGYTKRVLREAMKGLLPDAVRTKRIKTGFNAPFDSWMKGPLRPWLVDQVSSRSFTENSFFDGKSTAATVREYPDSINENDIWAKVHIAWWLERSRHDSSAGTESILG